MIPIGGEVNCCTIWEDETYRLSGYYLVSAYLVFRGGTTASSHSNKELSWLAFILDDRYLASPTGTRYQLTNCS